MSNDEQAIRDLVATWLEAGAAGDLPRLRSLLAEDVVFLTPGQAPMVGRDAFVAAFRTGLQQYHIGANTEIQEIQVIGDFAYYWSHLTVTVTPVTGGTPQQRAGYTLTVLRKTEDGKWVVSRDATCWRSDQP